MAALRDTAPLGALVSMALGAAVFTLGHAPPMGPVRMDLFLLGIAWTEFRPRPTETLPQAAGPEPIAPSLLLATNAPSASFWAK